MRPFLEVTAVIKLKPRVTKRTLEQIIRSPASNGLGHIAMQEGLVLRDSLQVGVYGQELRLRYVPSGRTGKRRAAALIRKSVRSNTDFFESVEFEHGLDFWMVQDEQCPCTKHQRLMLAPFGLYSASPVRCGECLGEVGVADYAGAELVREIVSWSETWDALYSLWLSSGAYERYAKRHMESVTSAVNAEGRELARAFETQSGVHVYCELFLETPLPYDLKASHCPACSGRWRIWRAWGTNRVWCPSCRLTRWRQAHADTSTAPQ